MRFCDLPEITHHVAARELPGTAACGSLPVGAALVDPRDWQTLRDLRARAVLCPACQRAAGLRHVALEQDRYGSAPRSLARLYSVGLLGALDRARNCPRCRFGLHVEGEVCADAHGLRRSEWAMWEECRRWLWRCGGLLEHTGWSTADLYLYADGSVAYYGRLAPLWEESGELTGAALAAALELLASTGRDGPKAGGRDVAGGPELGPERRSYRGGG